MPNDSQQPDASPGSAPLGGSTAQWRELALAAMRVNYYRPHPRAYWDDEMKPDSEKDYQQAMDTESRLKKELGL